MTDYSLYFFVDTNWLYVSLCVGFASLAVMAVVSGWYLFGSNPCPKALSPRAQSHQRRQSQDLSNPPRAHLKLLIASMIVEGVFKFIEMSVYAVKISEDPLISNAAWLHAGVLMTTARFGNAGLYGFYTAVIFMWQEALDIMEIQVKHARLIVIILYGVLILEVASVVITCTAMVWLSPSLVTAADDLKDLFISCVLGGMLIFYAWNLCAALRSISHAHGGTCHVLMARCMPSCVRGRNRQPAGDALSYIIKTQADSKVVAIATVSVLVTFGVVVRLIKDTFQALLILEIDLVLPKGPKTPFIGALWIMYYCTAEFFPPAFVMLLTSRSAFKSACRCLCKLGRRSSAPADAGQDEPLRPRSGPAYTSGNRRTDTVEYLRLMPIRDASRELVSGYDLMHEVA